MFKFYLQFNVRFRNTHNKNESLKRVSDLLEGNMCVCLGSAGRAIMPMVQLDDGSDGVLVNGRMLLYM